MGFLILALIIAFLSASRDKSYIRVLEEEVHMRDIIIRDYEGRVNK